MAMIQLVQPGAPVTATLECLNRNGVRLCVLDVCNKKRRATRLVVKELHHCIIPSDLQGPCYTRLVLAGHCDEAWLFYW